MNIFKSKRFFLILLILVFEFVLTLFSQLIFSSLSYLAFINHLSVISLLFFNFGLIVFIVQGGFFDGVVYSFKRFVRATRKKTFQEEDTEAPMAEYRHRNGKRSFIIWPLLLDSLFLFLLSIFLSWSL